jgi:Flp pilus assembly protein TadD
MIRSTRRGPGVIWSTLMISASLSLAGCLSQPTKSSSGLGPYASLYDGKSDVAFATLFPVSSPAEAIQRGDLAMAQGDLDRALFEYIRALDLDPKNAGALSKIGLIHAMRGNLPLAEMAYRWSLQEDPNNLGSLTGLGILLLKKRDYGESRILLEKAVGMDDRIARAHNALGVIADLERDYARAQRHYSRAIETSAKSAALMNNLGYSRYLGGNLKGAASAFRDALLIDPTYELAWRNLALVYTRQGRYDEAVETLTKVQDEAKSYNDVGYLLMVDGKLDKAQGYFEEAKRLSPSFYALADTNSRRVELMQGHAASP